MMPETSAKPSDQRPEATLGQSQAPVGDGAGRQAWLEQADGSRVAIQGNCSLGRAPKNQVVLADERVSRRHAIIHAQSEGEFWLVDLGSGNGTFINGRRVGQPKRLSDGDTIQMGAFQAVFRLSGGAQDPSTATLAPKQTQVDSKTSPCWLLLTDIEGSSRLSQHLDPGILAAMIGRWLARSKEAIEHEGGVINKYLGDGLLAYWPETQVEPTGIVAALGLLGQLQAEGEPPFRVVLHYGEVVMGGMASLGEESLFGREVNFVFRMERLAATLRQPRLLSDAAARQLGGGLATKSIGTHPIPGFEGEHPFRSF